MNIHKDLGELKDSGIERISSQDLSKLMKVTASQIRQDFNNFGGFGQQGPVPSYNPLSYYYHWFIIPYDSFIRLSERCTFSTHD